MTYAFIGEEGLTHDSIFLTYKGRIVIGEVGVLGLQTISSIVGVRIRDFRNVIRVGGET